MMVLFLRYSREDVSQNAPRYFSQVLEKSKSKATPCQSCDLKNKKTIYLTII